MFQTHGSGGRDKLRLVLPRAGTGAQVRGGFAVGIGLDLVWCCEARRGDAGRPVEFGNGTGGERMKEGTFLGGLSLSGLVRVGCQIIEQRRGSSEAVQRPGLLQ